MSQQHTVSREQVSTGAVSPGTWTLDPTASQIRFEVAHMWGLAKVKGAFERARGTMVVGPDSIDTRFSIDASSLNTNNQKRDAHLRSADFFDVEQYPEIHFHMVEAVPSEAGLTIVGDLLIRDARVRVELPVDADEAADRLVLRTTTSLPREAVGLGWNRVGMIRGDAEVLVELTLDREP